MLGNYIEFPQVARLVPLTIIAPRNHKWRAGFDGFDLAGPVVPDLALALEQPHELITCVGATGLDHGFGIPETHVKTDFIVFIIRVSVLHRNIRAEICRVQLVRSFTKTLGVGAQADY